LRPAKWKGRAEQRIQDSLRIVAFSDYGSHEIAPLIDFVRRLRPAPDLFLYAGEAIDGPDTVSMDRLRELAALTKQRTGAILGDTGTSDLKSKPKPVILRSEIGRKVLEPSSGEVRNANRAPIIVGNYVVAGCDWYARSGEQRSLTRASRLTVAGGRAVRNETTALRGRYSILLSHAPPEGVCDGEGSRQCGSRAVREVILQRRDIRLVVCGGLAFCGGKTGKVGGAQVFNVASSAEPGQPGRIALIEMRQGKIAKTKWTSLWDLASIPGMNQERKSALERAGVRTPCDLADAPTDSIARAIQAGSSEAASLRAQAAAFCRQDIVLLRNFPIPTRNRAYLTFENCNAKDDLRLVGVYLETQNRTRILCAETADDEKQILLKMLRLLAPVPGLTLICYSGGLWQQQLLSRRLACHGLPTRITQSIKDIYFDIQSCLALPVRRLGLREVAECCGFRWRGSTMAESRDSGICGTSQRLTKRQKERLIRRNEQALMALRHIVRYLDQRMARN
jgi:hypothetical protein